MKPLKCHPNREYNLYLVNYSAYMAKKHLKHLLERHKDELSPEIISELIQTRHQIKLIHELEATP